MNVSWTVHGAWVLFAASWTCSGSTNGQSQSPAVAAMCTPAGLENARALPAIPRACSVTPPPSRNIDTEHPLVIDTEEALGQVLQCPDGATPIDLGRESLLIVSYSLTPAQVGLGALDDGRTVTIVSRFSPPCPGAPRPHPGPTTFVGFRLPRGQARTFAQASCTVPTRCP